MHEYQLRSGPLVVSADPAASKVRFEYLQRCIKSLFCNAEIKYEIKGTRQDDVIGTLKTDVPLSDDARRLIAAFDFQVKN